MWLLDTNIVYELARQKPAERVAAWLTSQESKTLFVSDVTFAEIRFGIENSGNPIRREALRDWLTNIVRSMFAGQTVQLTEDVLFVWRGLASDAQKRGKTISQADSLIAATAAVTNLIMCTRDVSPYVDAGIPTLNPYTGERINGA